MIFKLTLTDNQSEVLGEYTIKVSTNEPEEFDDAIFVHPDELEDGMFPKLFKGSAGFIGEEILSDIKAIYNQRKGGRCS